MAKAIVYVVTAYKFGDREMHSYIVGVWMKKHAAMKAAEREEEGRGGKYVCEIIETEVDASTWEEKHKTIKELKYVDYWKPDTGKQDRG